MSYYRFLSFLLSIVMATTASAQKKNAFVTIGTHTVGYQVSGKGPAIILLHAGFMDRSMWRHQVRTLEKKYTVYVPDLPGHGSTVNAGNKRIQAAAFIKGFMDSLGIKKAAFAGVSLGAVAVTDFVIAYPQRVDRMLLVSPGINGWDKRYPVDSTTRVYFNAFSKALEERDTIRAAKVFVHYWVDGPYRPEFEKHNLHRELLGITLRNMYRHKISGWPVFSEKPMAIDVLEKIRVPVLIVYGNKDLPYINKAASELYKRIPGAKVVNIPNVAHMLNMEKPKDFEYIIELFEELPAVTRDEGGRPRGASWMPHGPLTSISISNLNLNLNLNLHLHLFPHGTVLVLTPL